MQSIFDYLATMVGSHSRWYSILPPVIVALLWAFCMANLLFLFVLFVLRVIDRPLHYGDDPPSSRERTALETLKRFPILTLADYILFCLISILLFLYIVAVTATGNSIISHIMVHYGGFIILLAGVILVGILYKLGTWLFSHVVIFDPDPRPSFFHRVLERIKPRKKTK